MPTLPSLASYLLTTLFVIYILGALGTLIRSYGPFRKTLETTKLTEALPLCDWLDLRHYSTNTEYTFRCSNPEVEHARIYHIRGLGNKILRRMKSELGVRDSLSEDPYKRLEDVERIRRRLAKKLEEAENSKWFKGFRSIFLSQSSEEVYGITVDRPSFNTVNAGRYFNAWYRYRCDDPDEEHARVQHLRMLNDGLWFIMPPVDWSNDLYSYDRNWCEDPIAERERIERVRQKVQRDIQRERTWGAALQRLLYFLLVTINPFYPQFLCRPTRERPLNNHHELSQNHVHKMRLYSGTVVFPTHSQHPPEQLPAPRALPATPPTSPTRNAQSKALPKWGPHMETAKIRTINFQYRYFISTGPHPGPLPMLCAAEAFQKGDLYIHRHTTDDMQVWLMEDNGAWRLVTPGHRHPTLPKYFLNVLLGSGKPNWVLRETWKGVAKRNLISAAK